MSGDLLEAFGQIEDKSREKGCDQQRTILNTFPPLEPTFDLSQPPPNLPQSMSSQSPITKVESIFQPGDNGGNDVLFDAAAEQMLDDDDDFGDFEDVNDAQPSTSMPKSQAMTSMGTEDSTQPATSQNSKEGNEAQLLDLLNLDDASPPSQPQPRHPSKTPGFGLDFFDASTTGSQQHEATHVLPRHIEDDNDEGWGDFEAFESSQTAFSLPARHATQIKGPPVSPQKYPTSARNSLNKPNVTSRPPNPLNSALSEPEDWDVFEDGPSQRSLRVQPSPTTNTKNETQHNSSLPPISEVERPTNIPPPAILLSLLPTTIRSLVVLISESPQSPSPNLPSLIRAHHSLISRLSSTPARTLRWRRDTLLAQSTRISIASRSTNNSGSGGMKLSSLNKGESIREEREAAETVEVWNRNVHHFSRVLSSANSNVHIPGQNIGAGAARGLKVSMNMPIKALTGAGVIQSALVCPVCGLKRSERVVGADDAGVEDVFGEYWLENWGHRDCAEWWYRWKGELSQR